MKCRLLLTTAAVAGLAAALVAIPSLSAAQAPPMGGGYTNVIAIPVNDPNVKAIAGALFKPPGAGPFPAVVYMPGCKDPAFGPEYALEKELIDHLTGKGVATLIIDPYTARHEAGGVCDSPLLSGMTFINRGLSDAYAALKALATTPDIDPKRIFLQGYGATRSRRSSPQIRNSRPKLPRPNPAFNSPASWRSIRTALAS
jgi:hypothetical protein